MKLSDSINENLTNIKNILTSKDIVFLNSNKNGLNYSLIFVRDLVDKESLGELVLRPLKQAKKDMSINELSNLFLSPEKKQVYTVSEIIDEILIGNAVLICDNMNFGFSFGLIKFEKRAITEPPTSAVIKGPREGFVESLPVNISMMRRRIKSSDLQIEDFKVGKYSKTTLAICYVKGIADDSLVKEVKQKLNEIDIDAVLDSSYISKFIGEHKTSIYKQVGNTEKPDILTAKIMEGRVAIFVDGSPIALTVPYLLIEDFQSPSDYYNSSYSSTLARAIRLISVLISILLPAFFVTAELFHLQLIPLSFLLTIVNSIKGIPLSPSFEMFFTLLIFEILNEASVRMPKYVGMVVSIVGGLVLGETAVTAGIISAPTLMIVALSGICLYTVPELEQTFSLIRFLFLIIGGSIGGYGLILSLVGIMIYTLSFESFSTPIFAPFSPLITKDLKDGLYKGFLIEQTKRPYSIKNVNPTRMKIKKRKEN